MPTVLSNPVLSGFHPDPSICQVDDRYYLACSSFEFLPGIPVYESSDLVTWSPVGHVVDREDQLDLLRVPTMGGAWAPTLRHRNGTFYVVVTDAMGRGNLLFTAEHIQGPWSDGTPLEGFDGIDPDLAWDAAGNCYLTYSGLQLNVVEGVRHLGIQQVRVDLASGKALEQPRSLWSGTGGIFPEAPHLYEIDGTWYLLVAEGGTERGHAVSIARGPSPAGPFQGCPHNPLLSARGTDRPVQNTGHADLFRTPDGGWAAVLLGVRPRGAVRSFSPMGRETYATPVRWEDGWPVFEPVALDDPRPRVVLHDDFDEELRLPWLAIRRTAGAFSSVQERRGWLIVHGDGSTMSDARPCFVGRRQQHEVMEVTALVDASEGVGGLSLRIDEDNHVDVEVDGAVVRARAVVARVTQTWQAPAPHGPIVLRLATVAPAPGVGLHSVTCDYVQVGFETTNGIKKLAEVDGRTLSAEGAGSFTGRVVGVYAVSGRVSVDWLHYGGEDNPR